MISNRKLGKNLSEVSKRAPLVSRRLTPTQEPPIVRITSSKPDWSEVNFRQHHASIRTNNRKLMMRGAFISTPFVRPLIIWAIALIGVSNMTRDLNCQVLVAAQNSLPENNLLATNRKSELNLEGLNLTSVPDEHLLCRRDAASELESTLNVVSLARNKISEIGPNSFVCVSTFLKILNLASNEIQHIRPGAFDHLESVQVLLLENNLLTSVPSIDTLKSLRHLNLADNQIEFIRGDSFNSSNLINMVSLNLKGNPLKEVAENAFIQLVGLKTLTLSAGQLKGQMINLLGLIELRFYHLDRNSNLQSISQDLCNTSGKLSSLVLKSNQFKRIPSQLAECESLLILDLSYNSISGILSQNLSRFPQLIDLYLGFNQIDSISEDAFEGLKSLQVLDLSNNKLTYIHPLAFNQAQIRLSLYDLNIANNKQLTTFQPQAGSLERLAFFKAYGNSQLRELPKFNSPLLLALTYAYHCCDYHSSDKFLEESRDELSGSIKKEPIIYTLIHSISAKLSKFFGINTNNNNSTQDNTFRENHRVHYRDNYLKFQENDDSQDESQLSEMILWPSSQLVIKSSGSSSRLQEHLVEHDLEETPIGSGVNKTRKDHARVYHRRQASERADKLAWLITDDWMIDELVAEFDRVRNENGILEFKSPSNGLGSSSLSEYGHLETEPNSNIQILEAEGTVRENTRNIFMIQDSWLDRRPRNLRSSSENRASEKAKSHHVTRCLPSPSALSPCQDLFDSWWLRLGIWSIFLCSFAGNLIVIIVLCSVRQSSSTNSALTNIMWLAGHSKRHIDVPRFLVINLAVADLLMSLYLAILAIVDLSTLGKFRTFAIKWQYSNACKLAGFLGVLSSELSVFILAVITLERNYAITNAVHLNRRLSLQKAMLIMLIGYLFAIGMAILPLEGIGDYRKYSICLPIEVESNVSNQLYVMSLLLINTLSFLLLLSCYLRMYYAIRGSQAWSTNDLRIAKRMSILVLMDFLCWFPIIVSAFAALFGHNMIGNHGLKVLTIFILPLNSVANPFLYAITTKKFKRDLNILVARFRSTCLGHYCCFCRNSCGCCHEPDDIIKQKQFEKFANFNNRNNNYKQNIRSAPSRPQRKHQSTLIELSKRGQLNQLNSKLINVEQNVNKYHSPDCDKQIKATFDSKRKLSERPGSRLAAGTGNQVTINKTTCCSCQHHLPRTAPSELSNCHTGIPPESSANVSDVRASCKPAIVLETAFEPVLSLALTPCGLTRKSLSNQEVISDGKGALRTTHNFRQVVSNQNSGSLSQQQLPHSTLLQPQFELIYAASHSDDHLVQLDSSARNKFQLRAESKPRAPVSRLYLSVNPNCTSAINRLVQAADDPQDRSASACGYRRNLDTCCSCEPPQRDSKQQGRFMASCHAFSTTSQEPTVRKVDSLITTSCSNHCGSATRSPAIKLARSISRLLFEPIAKAWSSTHMSLSSSFIANRPNQAQNTSRLHRAQDEPNQINKPSHALVEPLYPDEFPDDTFKDIDIKYTMNQRRMSRSCEWLIDKSQQLASASLSSNEPTYAGSGHPTATATTSSSQYEEDDKRILLATLNRIAAKRTISSTVERQLSRVDRERLHKWEQSYPNKPSCTRCRSWSPALLGKLEDCFNQIKSRIPRLAKNSRSNLTAGRNEILNEVTTGETGNTHIYSSDEDEFNFEGSASDNANDQGDELIYGQGSDCEEDELSERIDQFDCTKVRRSTMKRLEQSRRKQLSKIHQYSSANSDTLSNRTERTMLFNTSISLDSSTNVALNEAICEDSTATQLKSSSRVDNANCEDEDHNHNQ